MSLNRNEAHKSALQEAKERIEQRKEEARKEMEVRLFIHAELIPALRKAEFDAKQAKK